MEISNTLDRELIVMIIMTLTVFEEREDITEILSKDIKETTIKGEEHK